VDDGVEGGDDANVARPRESGRLCQCRKRHSTDREDGATDNQTEPKHQSNAKRSQAMAEGAGTSRSSTVGGGRRKSRAGGGGGRGGGARQGGPTPPLGRDKRHCVTRTPPTSSPGGHAGRPIGLGGHQSRADGRKWRVAAGHSNVGSHRCGSQFAGATFARNSLSIGGLGSEAVSPA